MIFVDIGAWFASLIPTDREHAAASAWLSKNQEPLITTDYVVDETLTLLRARGQRRRAEAFGTQMVDGVLAHLHFVTPDDYQRAWTTFRTFADKEWSFTDCMSKEVMKSLGVSHAFAFDHHFRQFGDVIVVP